MHLKCWSLLPPRGSAFQSQMLRMADCLCSSRRLTEAVGWGHRWRFCLGTSQLSLCFASLDSDQVKCCKEMQGKWMPFPPGPRTLASVLLYQAQMTFYSAHTGQMLPLIPSCSLLLCWKGFLDVRLGQFRSFWEPWRAAANLKRAACAWRTPKRLFPACSQHPQPGVRYLGGWGLLSHNTAGGPWQVFELQAVESTGNGNFFVFRVSAGAVRGLTSYLYAQVSIRKNERSPEVYLEK